MILDQSEFDVRCEWGERGVAVLAPISDAVVIVDVLSACTCISVAVARGASVFPYRWKDEESAAKFARSVGAELAGARGVAKYSLSPSSLLQIPAGTRLVLPSPNGSALSLATGSTPTLAGCVRNSKAVAAVAARLGRKVSVIAAGERWNGDRSLRPAMEDLIGAGAIIRHLSGALSPEARLAVEAFRCFEDDLVETFGRCSSGKELKEKHGFQQDLFVYSALDADDSAPILKDGAYAAYGA